jgi:hypothetical protein
MYKVEMLHILWNLLPNLCGLGAALFLCVWIWRFWWVILMSNWGIVIFEERHRRPLRLATGCVEVFCPMAKTTAHKRNTIMKICIILCYGICISCLFQDIKINDKQTKDGLFYFKNCILFFYSWSTLLRSGTVATGRKSLWPQATSPSLLNCCYSDRSIAMGRRCPSLLWLLVAMVVLTSFAHRYSSPQ